MGIYCNAASQILCVLQVDNWGHVQGVPCELIVFPFGIELVGRQLNVAWGFALQGLIFYFHGEVILFIIKIKVNETKLIGVPVTVSCLQLHCKTR